MKVKSDHHSKFSNFSNWKEEAWKISGLQRDSNPWPPRYWCDARPNKLTLLPMNSTNWPHSQCVASQLSWSSIAPVSRRSRARIPLNPDIFQASYSFQLLKLENLLQWSLFTFIYKRSTNMTFIYISHCLHVVINSKWTMFKNCKKQPLGDCAKDPGRWYNS